MSKKNSNAGNSWKRIAAGALSVALAAGALPANLGGFLTPVKGMVASAATYDDEMILYDEAMEFKNEHYNDLVVFGYADELSALEKAMMMKSWISTESTQEEIDNAYDALYSTYYAAKDIIDRGLTFKPVPYKEWDFTQNKLVDTVICDNYLVVTQYTIHWDDGYTYVVNSNVTIDERITVSGNVDIILCDGCMLNVPNGIHITEGSTLNIYGQSSSTGRLKAVGRVGVDVGVGGNNAAIGGDKGGSGGNIVINGGYIEAASSTNAAAIGGGAEGAGGNVTINSGNIHVVSHRDGAAIGGGVEGAGGNVTVNGGDIYSLALSGGAAIGSGAGGGSNIGSGGTLTVNGGSIVAKARDGAAIGGGRFNEGGTVTINGGDVAALGAYIGIGAGMYNYNHGKLYLGTGVKLEVGPNEIEWTKTTNTNEKNKCMRTTYVQPIPYKTWDAENKVLVDAEPCADFEIVDEDTTAFRNGKTYIVNRDVLVTDRIGVLGSAKLILCDGAQLSAIEGIDVSKGKELIIYGQEEGTGQLNVEATDYLAGIGGGDNGKCGTVTINGGNFVIRGGSSGAGIGGGRNGEGGTITINSGYIITKGGQYSAGIGGGYKGAGGTVTINGGIVETNGGMCGAGIGGGIEKAGGITTINGGRVIAVGNSGSAGIGGGYNGEGGTVTINGGSVYARGSQSYHTEDESVGIGAGVFCGEQGEIILGKNVIFKTSENDSKWKTETDTNARTKFMEADYFAVDYTLADGLEYTGEDIDLVTDASADDGTLLFGLSENSTTAPESWSETVKGKNAGTYYVWYKVAKGYAELIEPTFAGKVEIAKAIVTFSAPKGIELAYNGESQKLVTAGSVTKGGVMQYAVVTKEQKNQYIRNIGKASTAAEAIDVYNYLSDKLSWSSDVPEAKNIGDYYVTYRIVGEDNYESFPMLDSNMNFDQFKVLASQLVIPVTIKKGTAKVKVNSESAMIKDMEPTDGVYEFVSGNTYTIYSNVTLAASTNEGINISVTPNVEYENKFYNYMYTVEVADDLIDGTEIEFAHKHATIAYNKNTQYGKGNRVWAKCEGEPDASAECIAELDIKDTYYYGTAPAISDVKTKEYFGAVPEVNDIYFTLKNDTTARRITSDELKVGNDYTVHALVYVKINDKVTIIPIQKDISYKAIPLTSCEAEVMINGKYEPVEIKDGVISLDYLSYNSFAQSPVIRLKNNVLGDYVELTADDYKNQITPKVNAGEYTGTLSAISDNAKYSGSIEVKWLIKQADVTKYITVRPRNNADTDNDNIKDSITYDGAALEASDFEVVAAEVEEGDSAEVKAQKNLAKTFVDDVTDGRAEFEVKGNKYFDFKTSGLQKGTATIINSNFKTISQAVTPNIAKRYVTITPDANQSIIFGEKVPPVLTYDVEAENKNSNTGFITSDLNEYQTIIEFFKDAVKVGQEVNTTNILNEGLNDYFDEDDFDNDAGTYGYRIEEGRLANYIPVLTGDALFTVKQKDISSGDISVRLAPADSRGNKLEGVNFKIGEDNIPSLDYNENTQYVIVDSAMDDRTAMTLNKDYKVGGTTQKLLPGTFNVQIAGKGNYTGVTYSAWKINTLKGKATLDVIGDGAKTYDGKSVQDMFTCYKPNGSTVTITYYKGNQELSEAPKDAGRYTVKMVAKQTGHVDTIAEADLTIKPRNVIVTAQPSTYSVTYSYSAPSVGEAEFDGIIEKEKEGFLSNTSVNWTLDEANNQYTGEVKTTSEYTKNYEFTVKPVKYEVTAKDITSADIRVFYPDKTTLSATDKWATCHDITIIDTRNGKKLELGVDYTLNGNTSMESGIFTIEVIGINHYKGVKEVPWEVVDSGKEIVSPRVLSYRTYGKDQIEFTVSNTYNGKSKNIEYGVLLTNKSGPNAGDMTIESVDKKTIFNASLKFNTSVFRAQDIGKGVSARPYMKIDGKVVYGEQVYVTFKELNSATEAIHSEIMNWNKEDNKGTLRFTANFNTNGIKDAKYGVLLTNKAVDELTIDNALVDHKCKYAVSSFTASANGANGITLRTYIIVDGEYKYGPQVTYNYADYS